MPLKPSIGIVLLLVFNSSISFAQTFIGGSVNVGNQVVAEPFSEGIKRPFMLSGNVAIANVNRIYRNTYINYGAGLGLLAYNFSVKLQDTLSEGTRYSTREVSTLYLRTNLSIWQKVNIDSKPHFIGIGGGVTLQHTFFSRTDSLLRQPKTIKTILFLKPHYLVHLNHWDFCAPPYLNRWVLI